ncbi:MAG: septum formation initiator family protein [Prevotella sp.]|nr:septum formation initiator family protein [Prevotella sp.]MBR5919119.1 septum formation initiator family protein [Prevotella sp.]MBR6456716.1 septum formation initiator family protein [Prevotella sp.]
MASKIHAVWNFLSHYKYLIVVVVGVAVVGVIDDNSFLRRLQYDAQISNLKAEIEHYEAQNEENVRQLKELNGDPKAIEKIARERYFMKADDEDIFVFSEQ